MNYVTLQGQGTVVGDTLTVFNGTNAWWGEGDEKIYIDGEAFPSHVGTGTEDYYGYAWCRPEAFQSPFHAQPCGDGNLAGGFSREQPLPDPGRAAVHRIARPSTWSSGTGGRRR